MYFFDFSMYVYVCKVTNVVLNIICFKVRVEGVAQEHESLTGYLV